MPKVYINGKLYLNGRLCNGSARYNETEEERKQYKLAELRQLAKDNGIKGVSKLNKEHLCQAIKDFFEKDNVRRPIVEEPVAEPVAEPVEEPIQPLHHMKINETTISSISGPVSFYYFRPTNKLSKLPLIMLFGDYHRSKNNMCTDCTCSAEAKSCCYKISDRPLLKLFDTLASQYPVDFYTETSFLGTGTGFENGEMEVLTTGDMTSCYHHRLRGTNYNKCPTRNIRWHSGDIRQASDKYYSKYVINKYVNKLNSENTAAEYKKTSKYYNNNMYVESELEVIFIMIESGESLTEEDFRQTSFGSFEGFKRFIMILFGPEDVEHQHIFQPDYLKNFAHALFDFGNRSAIYKQIQKQLLDKLKNRQVWELLYSASLHKILPIDYKPGIKGIIKNIILSTTLENIGNKINKNAWFSIRNITVPLLDIYVLARMLKKPTGGKVSSLSIGYFGNFHVENMVFLLRNLGKVLDIKKKPKSKYKKPKSKYELVAKIDKSDMDQLTISRCLTMPPIDLNYELLKHNGSI